MSEKIAKGSLNTSKNDSPNHNDLTGGYQDHVDYEKSKENIYTVYRDHEIDVRTGKNPPTEEDGFLSHELKTYGHHFGKALQAQKDKYRKEGRKKMAEELDLVKWYNKFKPEAEVLQWGNIDTPKEQLPSAQELANMVDEYNAWKQKKLQTDKGGVILLDHAVHMGEATPHDHNRYVYYTVGEDGLMRPGDKKAVMIAAGYQAPDQDLSAFDQIQDEKDRKKAINEYERFNNPSEPFLEDCRSKWYDILEEHGYMVDRTPREPSRDLAKLKQNIITKHLNADKPAPKIRGDRHKSPKDFKESKRIEASRNKPDTPSVPSAPSAPLVDDKEKREKQRDARLRSEYGALLGYVLFKPGTYETVANFEELDKELTEKWAYFKTVYPDDYEARIRSKNIALPTAEPEPVFVTAEIRSNKPVSAKIRVEVPSKPKTADMGVKRENTGIKTVSREQIEADIKDLEGNMSEAVSEKDRSL